MKKLIVTLASSVCLLASAASLADGKATYDAKCAMCHASGMAGAPKVGDKAAWEARIAQGVDALVANATNGKNTMPPKGGCGDCTPEDIKAAVEHMVSQSQ
jgi:cytochrome c5